MKIISTQRYIELLSEMEENTARAATIANLEQEIAELKEKLYRLDCNLGDRDAYIEKQEAVINDLKKKLTRKGCKHKNPRMPKAQN